MRMIIFGTFILDFQSTSFELDSKLAIQVLSEYRKICGFAKDCDTFAMDDPVASAGWSFAKLFLSGEFVEKIYAIKAYEIDCSRGRKLEEKFVSWLDAKLKDSNCKAHIKIAREMK
ncbi:MAG TPA: hypothetical protein VE593_02550 [Nitrososphaeraceae archaeon]|jgi:hypothetical protein|nr:hypothetical protein [Nitrososphaeraceae archaeon]